MTWRYALAVEADAGGEHVWTIREIHTSDRGVLRGYSDPVPALGGSRGDLLAQCDLMMAAATGRVLDLTGDQPRMVHRHQLTLAAREGWHRG